jgi:hypothetical protein
MGQSFLTSVALSRHATASGGTFPGDAKPPELDIWWGIDRPNAEEIKSYVEEPAFTRAYLSIGRVVLAIMCVPLVE